MGPQWRQDPISASVCLGIAGASESPLICYNTEGFGRTPHHPPPPIIMKTILTPEEIAQLVATGTVELTDDLMNRMAQFCDLVDEKLSESYEDSDWYNDPNNVMSKHHY